MVSRPEVDPTIDYYKVMGIGAGATIDELKSAYRRRAKRCHPDLGGSHERMLELITAWNILSNPQSRALYDRLRGEHVNPGAGVAGSAEASAEWEEVARNARVQAATAAARYGHSWKHFRPWMNTVLNDIASAKYGSDQGFPTAENSTSGNILINAGAV